MNNKNELFPVLRDEAILCNRMSPIHDTIVLVPENACECDHTAIIFTNFFDHTEINQDANFVTFIVNDRNGKTLCAVNADLKNRDKAMIKAIWHCGIIYSLLNKRLIRFISRALVYMDALYDRRFYGVTRNSFKPSSNDQESD